MERGSERIKNFNGSPLSNQRGIGYDYLQSEPQKEGKGGIRMKQEIWHGDCLELMKDIPDKSVDMILCDLPYGTTSCKWDTIIPFDKLWEHYNRICKDDIAIVLFASEPFTSVLVTSNIKNYRHVWIWNKKLAGNAIAAKKQPLKIHEDVVVFSKGKCPYFPQMTKGVFRKKNGIKNKLGTFGDAKIIENDLYYPTTIQEFSNANLRRNKLHLCQKPVSLCEYLIKTHTNEGDLILDNCAGSGSTLVAAKNLNRQFIGIEKEKEYYDICLERLK